MAVLWMHGVPGCGKSVLTSSVIDHMKHFISADEHTAALAYFYFQFSDQDTSTVNSMLRSLISQLSSWKGSPPTELEKYASKYFQKISNHDQSRCRATCRDDVSQPSTRELISILRDIAKELDEVFLVLDGLDECVDHDELHGMIDEMLEWDVGRLHILLTSRFDPGLVTLMEARNMPIIEANTQVVDADIQLYIQEQLASHPRLRKWSAKLRAEIHRSLKALEACSAG